MCIFYDIFTLDYIPNCIWAPIICAFDIFMVVCPSLISRMNYWMNMKKSFYVEYKPIILYLQNVFYFNTFGWWQAFGKFLWEVTHQTEGIQNSQFNKNIFEFFSYYNLLHWNTLGKWIILLLHLRKIVCFSTQILDEEMTIISSHYIVLKVCLQELRKFLNNSRSRFHSSTPTPRQTFHKNALC